MRNFAKGIFALACLAAALSGSSAHAQNYPNRPILLIVPAFFLDLIWPVFREAPKWQQAVFGGVSFTAILIAVEWPWATFLMSPMARNRFFATVDFPYFALPTAPTVRHVFVRWERTSGDFWLDMALAFLIAVVSMWVGIYWGDWLRKVRR